MRKFLSSLIGLTLVFALVPTAWAAPKVEAQLKAFNITQNQDATKVKNRPGDVIRYTADVKNLGPGDLVDYEMKVYIKDLLAYADIVDLGGGVIEGDYIKFPPILQAFGCNCSNANYFKIKIKDNICPPNSLSARFEYVTTTIQLDCVPTVPVKTGPETNLILLMALLISGGVFVGMKMRKARA